MKVGEAFVEIRPDLKGFQGEAERGIGGSMRKLAGIAAGAFAAAGIGKAITGIIGGASDLNETISKSNTIFGKSGRAIEQWAGSATKSMGQSKQQALEAAATFGNMFSQLGIGGDVTASMSKQMVQLASDFASFHNADITEVLEAQQAAFRGEYDAVQRFVPTITAAAVEQRALAMTHKATTAELTAQDKALATQALLMEGAGAATGDFARTSGGLANKQRILGAELQNVKDKIGQALLPAVSSLVSFVSDRMLPMFDDLAQRVRGVDLDGLKTAASDAGNFLRDTLLPVVQDFNDFLRDKLIPTLAQIVDNYLKAIKGAFDDITAALQRNKPELEALTNALRVVGDVLSVVVIPGLRLFARSILDPIVFFGRLVSAVIDSVGLMVGHFRDLLNVWLTVVGGIVHAAASAFSWVPGVGGKLKGAAAEFDHFRDAANRALGGIQDKVVKVIIDAQKAGAAIPGGYRGVGSQGSRAGGGKVWPGMWLVGEKGPELLQLGTKGFVTNATDTAKMLATMGGDGGIARPFVPSLSPAATQVVSLAVTVHAPNYVGSREELANTIADSLGSGGGLVDAVAEALRRRDAALH